MANCRHRLMKSGRPRGSPHENQLLDQLKVFNCCPAALLYVHCRLPAQDARSLVAIDVGQVNITRTPGSSYNLGSIPNLCCEQIVNFVDGCTFSGGDTENVVVTITRVHI